MEREVSVREVFVRVGSGMRIVRKIMFFAASVGWDLCAQRTSGGEVSNCWGWGCREDRRTFWVDGHCMLLVAVGVITTR
jgi:hypothetical protein